MNLQGLGHSNCYVGKEIDSVVELDDLWRRFSIRVIRRVEFSFNFQSKEEWLDGQKLKADHRNAATVTM